MSATGWFSFAGQGLFSKVSSIQYSAQSMNPCNPHKNIVYQKSEQATRCPCHGSVVCLLVKQSSDHSTKWSRVEPFFFSWGIRGWNIPKHMHNGASDWKSEHVLRSDYSLLHKYFNGSCDPNTESATSPWATLGLHSVHHVLLRDGGQLRQTWPKMVRELELFGDTTETHWELLQTMSHPSKLLAFAAVRSSPMSPSSWTRFVLMQGAHMWPNVWRHGPWLWELLKWKKSI